MPDSPSKVGQIKIKVELLGYADEVASALEALGVRGAPRLRVQTVARRQGFDPWFHIGSVAASDDGDFRRTLSSVSHRLDSESLQNLWATVDRVRRVKK